MKKIVDYSVLVASGVLVANGLFKGFKSVKSGDYKSLLMIGLGVAVASYAFSYALDRVKPSPILTKEVIVVPVDTETEGE